MIDWILTARLAAALVTVLVVLTGAGLAAIAWLLARAHRASLLSSEATNARLDALAAEVSQLAAANVALRESLTALGERVERPEALPQAAAPTTRAYDLAARLAAGGAASLDLVTNCGLTPAEAELAVLVHGARARGAAATH